jgi:hypothetical protein
MASPSLAAVRPAAATNLGNVQLGTGARLGAGTARHSNLTGAGVPLAILAAAAVGVGVAAGVGAFDHNHHDNSVSP